MGNSHIDRLHYVMLGQTHTIAGYSRMSVCTGARGGCLQPPAWQICQARAGVDGSPGNPAIHDHVDEKLCLL